MKIPPLITAEKIQHLALKESIEAVREASSDEISVLSTSFLEEMFRWMQPGDRIALFGKLSASQRKSINLVIIQGVPYSSDESFIISHPSGETVTLEVSFLLSYFISI